MGVTGAVPGTGDDVAPVGGTAEATEELRLALVLNGGVSLTVWIGGVTHEIHRLCIAHPSSPSRPAEPRPAPGGGPTVWEELLTVLGTRVRADVMSGASAGGINGVLLALALVHPRADLFAARDVWIVDGDFEALMRSPVAASTPSLLKGDYFLERIRDTMALLAAEPVHAANASVPIDLTLMATLVNSLPERYPDDFGAEVSDSTNRAEIRFSHPRSDPADDVLASGTKADVLRLALASRSTASFPGAFEPVFCRVGGKAVEHVDDDVDMVGTVDFRVPRYLADGGILANKPFAPTLRSIFAQAADGPTRRCLVYVVPDPSPPEDAAPDERDKPPAPFQVIWGALSSIPRNESIGRFVEDLRRNNRAVQSRRDDRARLVSSLVEDQQVDGAGLAALLAGARPFHATFRSRRVDSSLALVTSLLRREQTAAAVRAADGPGQAHVPGARSGRERPVDEAALRGALEAAVAAPLEDALAWVPPGGADPYSSLGDWGWSSVERAAGIGLHLVRLVERTVMPSARALAAPGRASELLADLQRCRRDLHFVRQMAGRQVDGDLGRLREAARLRLADAAPATTADLAATVAEWLPTVGSASPGIGALAGALGGLPGAFDRALQLVDIGPANELAAWAALFRGVDGGGVVTALLAFEVFESVFTADAAAIDQRVDLLQVSAAVVAPIDPLGRSEAIGKVAGTQLGHFGAFLKRSWRANDWMWGRLDGVTRLSRVVLAPAALHGRFADADDAWTSLAPVLLAPATHPDRPFLVGALGPAGEAGLRSDLAAAMGSDPVAAMSSATRLADALARRVQLEVLREELPEVATAVRYDMSVGGNTVGAGPRFLEVWERWLRDERAAARHGSGPGSPSTRARQAVPVAPAGGRAAAQAGDEPLPRLAAASAQALLEACTIGRETVTSEIGSDLSTRVAATAAATGSAMVKQASPRVAGPLVAAIRTPLLAFWSLAQTTPTSGALRQIAIVALAVGGTIVGLDLFVAGQAIGGIVAQVGWLLVIAGLVLALVRAPVLMAAVVVGFAAAAGIWFAVDPDHRWRAPEVGDGAPFVVGAALLVVALGSIREPRFVRRRRPSVKRSSAR